MRVHFIPHRAVYLLQQGRWRLLMPWQLYVIPAALQPSQWLEQAGIFEYFSFD